MIKEKKEEKPTKKSSEKKSKKKITPKKKTAKKTAEKSMKKENKKEKVTIRKTEKKPKEEKKEKKIPSVEAEEKKLEKEDIYYEAVGKRKTAVAIVRMWEKGKKEITVNDKKFEDYFPTLVLQKTARASLETMNCLDKFKVSVVARGGGLSAQSEAVRHGTARALEKFNPDFRKRLKKEGYLTRDSRMRERKKPGLKRARRAPQWSKR